jgi:hypothetical protein
LSVDMFAMFPEIVFKRTRCATNALVLISKGEIICVASCNARTGSGETMESRSVDMALANLGIFAKIASLMKQGTRVAISC